MSDLQTAHGDAIALINSLQRAHSAACESGTREGRLLHLLLLPLIGRVAEIERELSAIVAATKGGDES